MKTYFLRGLVALFLFLIPAFAQQSKPDPELLIAAAADLNPALKDISEKFEKKTGMHVKLSFGASGALTQQVRNGAPFDIFFSADMDFPRTLIQLGLADSSSLYKYALGKIVLWVPADSPLDPEQQKMNVLLDPSVQKIAIANPQHAPYGRAAAEALRHAGLYDRLTSRFVMGENVSQAAQFVESKNAQAGFVALAHALSPAIKDKGRFWIVPADYYSPLDQGVVLVSKSQHKAEAQQFMEFFKTQEVSDTLQKYGFTLPKN